MNTKERPHDVSLSVECNEHQGSNHQDRLAASLVDHLGIVGAVRACRTNSWDGVLDRVRQQTPSPLTVIHSPDSAVSTLILPPARSGGQRN